MRKIRQFVAEDVIESAKIINQQILQKKGKIVVKTVFKPSSMTTSIVKGPGKTKSEFMIKNGSKKTMKKSLNNAVMKSKKAAVELASTPVTTIKKVNGSPVIEEKITLEPYTNPQNIKLANKRMQPN